MTKSKKCRQCRYRVSVNIGWEQEMLEACTYILWSGRKRPCPPGDGCTVYEPLRKRKDEKET